MPKCRWCAQMMCTDRNRCQAKDRCYPDSHLEREHPCWAYEASDYDAATGERRRPARATTVTTCPGQETMTI